MTQTTIETRPMTAVTTSLFTVGVLVTKIPMTSVDLAREEFGPTPADAQAFVLGTCCTECGLSREDTETEGRECRSCGISGCACLVAEDAHSTDVFWCAGCQPVCGGYCCTD